MKSFKAYIKSEKEIPFLDWESSHSEMRDKQKIKEEWHGQAQKHDTTGTNKFGQSYDAGFHDHPDVKPRNITLDHGDALQRYATTPKSDSNHGHASSHNINMYLRNRAGRKDKKIEHGHKPEDVEDAVKKLSSAFKKENTNKRTITTYGGIPSHAAEKMTSAGEGSEHHLSGFTSTSSSQKTAKHFANMHNKMDKSKTKHVVKYTIKPGGGLSAVHHTDYNENEVILHHGAKVKYHHTDVYKGTDGEGDTHVHHVTVTGKHKPLSDYGDYEA